MEAKIQYFQSPVFGQIRVTVIDDKPMFVANDVAAMLGYSNRYDAINRHCKGVVKHEGSQSQQTNMVKVQNRK